MGQMLGKADTIRQKQVKEMLKIPHASNRKVMQWGERTQIRTSQIESLQGGNQAEPVSRSHKLQVVKKFYSTTVLPAAVHGEALF